MEARQLAGESQASMRSKPMMVATLLSCCRYRCYDLLPPAKMFQGNPRSGSPRSDDDNTFSVAFPFWGIILEQVMPKRVCWWGGVSSTGSTVAGLDDMV
jgi:hypothetical protein